MSNCIYFVNTGDQVSPSVWTTRKPEPRVSPTHTKQEVFVMHMFWHYSCVYFPSPRSCLAWSFNLYGLVSCFHFFFLEKGEGQTNSTHRSCAKIHIKICEMVIWVPVLSIPFLHHSRPWRNLVQYCTASSLYIYFFFGKVNKRQDIQNTKYMSFFSHFMFDFFSTLCSALMPLFQMRLLLKLINLFKSWM